MDLNKPLGVISPTVDAEVLAVLAGADETFTGAKVHQLIGTNTQKTVWTALQRLCEQGVVLKIQKGSAGLYSLNREHLAAPYILALANLKNELLRKMTKAMNGWNPKPVFAAIFGSAARGEMRLDSDIDIFIVRPDNVDVEDNIWMTYQAGLADSVSKWTGNDARIFELSETEVAQGLEKNERVLMDIKSEAIMLIGDRFILNSSIQSSKQSVRKKVTKNGK